MASAVKLKMVGEIKLKKWLPFKAEQVVRADQGFVWSAAAKSGLLSIAGFDKFIDEIGEMRWKLFGILPVMVGTGPDITRSAKDRFAIEHLFLPTALARSVVGWTTGATQISFESPKLSKIDLKLNELGGVETVSMQRWGSPSGGQFGLYPFGGFVDEESTWDGCTISSRLRIGWHFGTEKFSEGEFFRAKITHAEFRL